MVLAGFQKVADIGVGGFQRVSPADSHTPEYDIALENLQPLCI
ncbi:MAG: hypothetical protein AB7P76_00900 [Candidatus Melainabacteria bacterium]